MTMLGEWQPYGNVAPEQLDRLANRLLVATALLMFVPLAGSLARLADTGWLFIYTFQSLLYGSTLLIFLVRNLLGTRFKAAYLVVAYYLIPALGIYSLGQLKGGIMYLPIAIVIAVFYFGPRVVALLAVIGISGLAFVAQGFIAGRLNSAISLEVANTSIPQWANFGFSFFAFFVMFAIVMFGYRTILAAKVGETEQQRDEILQLKNYDQLTGVATLPLALDFLETALAAAKEKSVQGALLLVRLENLEQIIDTRGFEAGEQAVQAAGSRLSTLLRPEDLLARVGGSRFLVVIPSLEGSKRVEFLAQMIHEQMAKALVHTLADGDELHLQCKIGITLFPAGDLTAEQFVQRVNTARYHAEKKGLDTFLLE